MKYDLEELFTYHAPKPGDPERYQAIRSKAKELAQVIIDSTPAGHDQDNAIRQLRTSVMFANASIALETTSKE